MLRATDNKYIGLYTNDVKRLLLTTVVEMGDYPIEGMMSVYDDFRVSRNLNSITICDVADDRAVLACEVSKYTIPCGIMCM